MSVIDKFADVSNGIISRSCKIQKGMACIVNADDDEDLHDSDNKCNAQRKYQLLSEEKEVSEKVNKELVADALANVAKYKTKYEMESVNHKKTQDIVNKQVQKMLGLDQVITEHNVQLLISKNTEMAITEVFLKQFQKTDDMFSDMMAHSDSQQDIKKLL